MSTRGGWDRETTALGGVLELAEALEDGAELPTHQELQRRLNVPERVVTGALAEARRAGAVHGGQGLRTTARRPVLRRHGGRLTGAVRALHLGGFFSDAGPTATIIVHEVREGPCPAPAAERLSVPTGSEVLIRRRTYRTDDGPVQMATSYVPVALARQCPALYGPGTGPGGMYARFTEVGHAPVIATEDVRARVPSGNEVRALEIDGRAPVFVVWRTVFNETATPLEAVRIVLRADRVRLAYTLEMT